MNKGAFAPCVARHFGNVILVEGGGQSQRVLPQEILKIGMFLDTLWSILSLKTYKKNSKIKAPDMLNKLNVL